MGHVVCATEEPTLVKYDPLVVVYLLYNTYIILILQHIQCITGSIIVLLIRAAHIRKRRDLVFYLLNMLLVV